MVFLGDTAISLHTTVGEYFAGLIPKLSKSSMRSSNPRGGSYWFGMNRVFWPKWAKNSGSLASPCIHTMCVETNKLVWHHFHHAHFISGIGLPVTLVFRNPTGLTGGMATNSLSMLSHPSTRETSLCQPGAEPLPKLLHSWYVLLIFQ